MKISRLILGRSVLLFSGIGLAMAAAAFATGCGQRGPLFLAPQSVPLTLLPPASANGAASAANAPAGTASAPATAASAAK